MSIPIQLWVCQIFFPRRSITFAVNILMLSRLTVVNATTSHMVTPKQFKTIMHCVLISIFIALLQLHVHSPQSFHTKVDVGCSLRAPLWA